MKTIKWIILFGMILFSGCNNSPTTKNKFEEVFANAPTIDISSMIFDFDFISEDEKNIVDSLSFISIYQVDSLINKSGDGYYIESPIYVIGKVSKINYDILITIRYFGYWFKTIDMLTYNKHGVLRGFIFLATYGGGDYRTYDTSGYFDNNIYILTEDIKDIDGEYNEVRYIKCIIRNKKYLINDNGEISLIDMNVEEIDCPPYK